MTETEYEAKLLEAWCATFADQSKDNLIHGIRAVISFDKANRHLLVKEPCPPDLLTRALNRPLPLSEQLALVVVMDTSLSTEDHNTIVKSVERLRELEDVLTSARTICQRMGDDTAWERFDSRLAKLGIGNVTPRQFKLLPSDYEPEDTGSC